MNSMEVKEYLLFFNFLKMSKKDYSKNLPTKKWAQWASKHTGKPEMEWWLQGMFYLTECEGLSHEEATKIMEKNWDK
jgi:hypothetical protein